MWLIIAVVMLVKVMENDNKTLWKILDDIDTLSDRMKPSTIEEYQNYMRTVARFTEKRFDVFTSDGFSIFITSR